MAYSDAVIFQRTDLGKAEIQNKQHGLTQSERLVLIIADGVSSYAELRVKLKSLVKERFDRTLRSLSEKGLLYEVMFPLDNQVPDIVEAEAMDRFLRQEDSDPVSVISFQPEEEFGDIDLPAEGVLSVDQAAELKSGEPDPSSPDLAESALDGLGEPVIAAQEKISARDEAALEPEPEPATRYTEVDYYLPLSAPEGPVVAPEEAVKSIAGSPGKVAEEAKLPASPAKEAPRVIQKFPEPKPPEQMQEKKRVSLSDYLDHRYSLLLMLLGVCLALMPTLVRLLK
ncbi:hypothetical protein LPB67_11245 [Undibacterium sp. Jales W-56]|uniref:hypothetical protein n=1 Tax=Undibacterium sp. Jales W-56 TaxID=2897325 RepID=UPI0021D01316|nr:hypothetical protein [Undibacterium sp. Jales W-56]MCU6434347.1 hypothetical protein [Undibacterium sp. Jales W-56]